MKLSKKNKRNDIKTKIIKRQIDEIDGLKQQISELEIDCDKKDEIINSIETMREDFASVIDELKEQEKEYNMLIDDLMKMRNVMNQEFFKGRWKLVRLLIK
jgi:chromosome segregation ATPase